MKFFKANVLQTILLISILSKQPEYLGKIDIINQQFIRVLNRVSCF